jgi:hypothetical protein
MLQPIQQQIGAAFGYEPLTQEEGNEPADTSCCLCKVRNVNGEGWPEILWKRNWYSVPTLEEVEEWVFDSVCFTPDEDEVEPDHPDSWLSILGMI